MGNFVTQLWHAEEGHAISGGASLLAAVGLIALTIGAVNETDWLTIAGGVVAALAILAEGIARHRTIDWEVYHRLEELERKQS